MDEIISRIEALERENARLRARAEVQNVAARYADLMLSGQSRRVLPELWSSDEGIRLEYCASGVYEGRERIEFFFDKEPTAGKFSAYQLTTPYIEIAEDGLSARGVWGVIGAESDAGERGPNPPQTAAQRAILSSEDGDGLRYRAEWVWQRMEIVFRLEGGAWRIFSMHVHELFRCPYDESWVTWAEKRWETDGLRLDALFDPAGVPDGEKRPPEFNASFATTRHWQYSPDAPPPYGVV
jgi:hypothetical protein